MNIFSVYRKKYISDVLCEFTIDNAVSKVYIDGVDKTSTVSGSLDGWWNKKRIEFTSKARTIAVFGRDYELGCRTGGFAMKCTSSDPDWNNLTTDLATDNVWKVKGSYYVESDVNNVCPSNWASSDNDDVTWKTQCLQTPITLIVFVVYRITLVYRKFVDLADHGAFVKK